MVVLRAVELLEPAGFRRVVVLRAVELLEPAGFRRVVVLLALELLDLRVDVLLRLLVA